MEKYFRAWAAALLLAVVGQVAAAPATRASIAEQPWIRGHQFGSLTLSPDGRNIAGIGYGNNATAALLIDVETTQARLLAKPERDPRYRFGQIPIAVNWVANDLLVVDYNNRESVSVDLAGKPVAKLGERFIRRVADGGPLAEFVLVYRDVADHDIDLVNARTGERRKYVVSLPGLPVGWTFDDAGELRAVTMLDSSRMSGKAKFSNFYRGAGGQPWQLLQEWAAWDSSDRWYPLRVLPQADTLAVLARHERDSLAVFKYDTRSRQFLEVMAAHPTDDILQADKLDADNVERVVTGGLLEQTVWFEPRWASLQASVDAALPGRINRLQGDPHGRVLISSYGDVDPGRWLVVDTATSKLREILVAMPGVDPKQQRPMQALRYKARDGLDIPAYLTLPAGAASEPAPTVVVVHGGPNVRDRWGWDDEVQLLAQAGYVVFQPQFRGSAGFGRRFEEAGYRQWGRAMQDDITDGVGHLVAQKITDPKRVCIYGASYGGYAALWGVIKTPELYKCGISFAGISDLADQISGSISDDSTVASREISRHRVGDPDRDRTALDAVSPLLHANQVRVPLLIAHGDDDLRVPPSQSRSMVRALERAGRPVEWMPLADEGHGLTWVRSRVRFYTALLNFLDRHLSPGKQNDAESAATAAR